MQPLLGSSTAPFLQYPTQLKSGASELTDWSRLESQHDTDADTLAVQTRANGKPKRPVSHLTKKLPRRICSGARARCRVTGTILRGLPAKDLFVICLSLYIWPGHRRCYWLWLGCYCLEWEAIYLHRH